VIVSEDNGHLEYPDDSRLTLTATATNRTRDSRLGIVGSDRRRWHGLFRLSAEDRLTEVMDPADKAGDTHPKVAGFSRQRVSPGGQAIDVRSELINGNPIRNATFVAATAGQQVARSCLFRHRNGGNNWACGSGDDCSGDTGLFPRDPFAGVWYLYISTTLTRQDLDYAKRYPGDPIQRGGICGGGTCRNLLDFMDLRSTGRPHSRRG